MSISQNRKIRRITDSTLVVGADIAKKIHVARASNARGIELGRPLSFDNTRRGMEKLLAWMRTLMADHGCDNVVFGVEPTGHYWMNLAQFLRQHGIDVVLVNPLHVKKSKELDDNNPTKNDHKDARVISQLVKDGRYSVPNIPKDIYAELRVGMNQRERLIEDLKRVQGRIHNWLDRFFPEFTEVFRDWEGKAALVCLHECPCPQDIQAKAAEDIVHMWREHGISRGVGKKRATYLVEMASQSVGLTEGLQMARQELKMLLDQYDLLQEQLSDLLEQIERLLDRISGAAQMLSVPGVGVVTVAGFLAEVEELSAYEHWRQVQKLAGFNLKENSSGKHKGQTKITKRGRPRLRALLYRCVLILVAKNPQFQALHQYYTTRVDNPLRPMSSLIALCCKLIRILFTLGRKQVPYDPEKAMGPVRSAQLFAA
ncbi:IS110 family transposase [Alicyclobacillus cycloheptanicus]|nr:IS110 family transposase [Alicyclobacillus cycloheptanicus]WDL99997.1 IS110 family transposase [Alicyclobacillus cycloheptanicus]WDM00778.1 IS110 family transposase [Alicyclobacillus cycloheptanicus]WDM00893.1 IS110 family transposase [Alicyclobacillus cycloheptanicus]WDM02440.1 IS110 family transposase [Alicyclobacillus cycloheptanicus]